MIPSKFQHRLYNTRCYLSGISYILIPLLIIILTILLMGCSMTQTLELTNLQDRLGETHWNKENNLPGEKKEIKKQIRQYKRTYKQVY